MSDEEIVVLAQANPGTDIPDLNFDNEVREMPARHRYSNYYMTNMFQHNYRIRSVDELDELPRGSIVIALNDFHVAVAYKREMSWGSWLAVAEGDYDSDELFRYVSQQRGGRLFVVFNPNVISGKEGRG